MQEICLRICAVAIAATLSVFPACAQQSQWASADDKTAKYVGSQITHYCTWSTFCGLRSDHRQYRSNPDLGNFGVKEE
jgi:hypothetical protein